MAGARWVQNDVLEANPKADLAVYAVWFNMIASDDRSHWPAQLLTDRRVQHFWDEDRIVGAWYMNHVTRRVPGQIEWDAFFIYGPEGKWEAEPPLVLSWGRTIIESKVTLKNQIESVIHNSR